MIDLLAILGRGIYQVRDKQGKLRWKTTALLERYDSSGRHRVFKETIDDNDPLCLIGGGNANVTAGLELVKERPRVIVLAYGTRASYLQEINAPSEGQVMLNEFQRRIGNLFGFGLTYNPQLYGGMPDESLPEGTVSNTLQELRNILDLALEANLKNVMIVTVRAHARRTKFFLHWLLENEYSSAVQQLNCSVRVSENILVSRSRRYLKVVEALEGTLAMERSMDQEDIGIHRLRSGFQSSEAYQMS